MALAEKVLAIYTRSMLRQPPPIWTVPVLETPRLRLRAHTLADFDHFAALWATPEVVRFIGGKPGTREESWARLLRHAGHWAMLGFGSWLVEEKSTGDFAGEVGFFNYHRDIDPPLGDVPEIGWIISPTKHGLGYATEAVEALLAWADQHFIAPEAVCIIDPENASSLRVAHKCGFTFSRGITYREKPCLLLTRPLHTPPIASTK